MSIIINSKKFEIPGIKTVCWADAGSKIKYVTDKDNRAKTIRGIVIHTHEGKLNRVLKPGLGPNTTMDDRLASYQTNTDRYVSWDYTIDLNGDVTCQNDPAVHYTWHGNNTNPYTLGIELIQESDGSLYDHQLDKVVLFLDFLTNKLGIQRQIPWDKTKNEPVLTQIPRIRDGNGQNVVGIYGHVNITSQRGIGDPGSHIFNKLKAAGYEGFELNKNEDVDTWKARQTQLGLTADGLPLKDTVEKLKISGNKSGLFVERPIDLLI